LLNHNKMSVTWELVPGRGAKEKSIDAVLAAAAQAAQGGKVHALTITDNPGGNPAILPDHIGLEILKLGIDPLVHFTCKDKNRNQIESQLYALDRAGVQNLLVMTGDYPVNGFRGRPKPVFDIDPTHVLELITEMNKGLEYPGFKGITRHQPSVFFSGAAVSPFKATEAEQMAQYFKLKKKIASGAQFVVTQLGYDARKFQEVLQLMKLHNLNVPIIGNIYVLPFGAARLMNENKFPGCVVPDKLLGEIDKERTAPDKGVGSRLLRAAKMYAFMKGMGFDGVHIGGNGLKYEQVEYIIEKGEELSFNWPDLVHEFDYPIPEGFYFFERDKKTGLNSNNLTNLKGRPLDTEVTFLYQLSRLIHHLFFEPEKNMYRLMKTISQKVQGSRMENCFHSMEHLAKVILYDCKDCGDCALPDLAYNCPMSQCPKNQRNGPCGGSYNGWCEVYPQKRKCIYVKAYSWLKKYKEEKKLDSHHIAPCNWDLYQTSSWINFYLGKDHCGDSKKLQLTVVWNNAII
jgi:methylenetetrahydrofolate reductase (NADPH)